MLPLVGWKTRCRSAVQIVATNTDTTFNLINHSASKPVQIITFQMAFIRIHPSHMGGKTDCSYLNWSNYVCFKVLVHIYYLWVKLHNPEASVHYCYRDSGTLDEEMRSRPQRILS